MISNLIFQINCTDFCFQISVTVNESEEVNIEVAVCEISLSVP